MNDLQKAEQRLTNAKEAFEFVQLAANSDRKLSHDKHMNGHYTKALDELRRVIEAESAMLVRIKAIGR